MIDELMDNWGMGFGVIMIIGMPLFGLFLLLDNLEYVPMVLFVLIVPAIVGTITMKYTRRKKKKVKKT